MIEILNTGISGKTMVYVTIDEKQLVDKLFRIKDATAVYCDKGRKCAYHFLLNPITITKYKIKGNKVDLPNE